MNEHIDKLIKLVQVAKTHNSKEIRISTSDAEQICVGLVELLNTNNDSLKKILMLQERLLTLQESSPTNNIYFNGGTF